LKRFIHAPNGCDIKNGAATLLVAQHKPLLTNGVGKMRSANQGDSMVTEGQFAAHQTANCPRADD